MDFSTYDPLQQAPAARKRKASTPALPTGETPAAKKTKTKTKARGGKQTDSDSTDSSEDRVTLEEDDPPGRLTQVRAQQIYACERRDMARSTRSTRIDD
jgi:hypothetical protein